MEQKMMRKFKWFWAWDDEKEEAWLRQMAQAGWQLKTIGFPGFYFFNPAKPADIVYRLDFNGDSKNYPAYLKLFADADWEHVVSYGSWQYFRTPAKPGENPEIYSDNASKIAKYQRVIALLVVFLPILMVGIRSLNSQEGVFYQIAAFVEFLLLLLYIYAMLKLVRRISQLKRLRE